MKITGALCVTVRHRGHAVILGVVQGIALLPGISRMAITYATARWLRFSPRLAFELSCAIQWPLIAAAFCVSFLRLAQLPAHNELRLFIAQWQTICVIGAASLVALIGLCFVQRSMVRGTVWRFAYYMSIPLVVWVVAGCGYGQIH